MGVNDMKENKDNNKAMFIKTQDLEMFENLEKSGFDLIDYSNGTWTFINDLDYPLTFNNNKIVYSNTLCF